MGCEGGKERLPYRNPVRRQRLDVPGVGAGAGGFCTLGRAVCC